MQPTGLEIKLVEPFRERACALETSSSFVQSVACELICHHMHGAVEPPTPVFHMKGLWSAVGFIASLVRSANLAKMCYSDNPATTAICNSRLAAIRPKRCEKSLLPYSIGSPLQPVTVPPASSTRMCPAQMSQSWNFEYVFT